MSTKPPHEDIESIAENAERDITASSRSQERMRHVGGILLIIYAIQLALFGILAWLVHIYPVNPIDTTITREFQENPMKERGIMEKERARTRSIRNGAFRSFNRE